MSLLIESNLKTNEKLDKLVEAVEWVVMTQKEVEQKDKEKLVWASTTRTMKKLYILRPETIPNSWEFQLTGNRYKTMEELHKAGKKLGRRYTWWVELIPQPSVSIIE